VTDPVVVYGANGATGARLVELALAAGLRPVVAGRRREPLEAVAAPHRLEVRVASLDDLDPVVAGAAVVVSCVAPYTTRGRPLVDAALRHRAHYVDCTGEPRYVQGLMTRDADARRAGVVLVPAAGIGLVANVVARAAVQGLLDVRRLTVDYLIEGMRPSWGTVRSTVRLLAGWAPIVRESRTSYVLPGSRIRRLAAGSGALFPLTDTLTLARQWPGANVESYMRSRVPRAMAVGLAAGGVVCRAPGVPEAVDRLAQRFADRGGHPRGHVIVTVTAEGPGARQTAVADVADIYEVTSQAACELVRALLTGGADVGFRASGEVIGKPDEVAPRIGIDLRMPETL
jgi:hypothetical protein